MDFAQLAARLVLDDVYPEQFPDIAIQALLDGAEADSFILLAGESGSAPTDELRRLLVAALAENGTPLPDPVAAAQVLKRHYAQQVAIGSLSPIEGARRIIDFYRDVEHLIPRHPGGYVGDSFGIARLYGLEDAWCEAYAERPAIEAELLQECAGIAAD